MQKLFYIFLFFSYTCLGQKLVETTIKDSTVSRVKNLVNIDAFGKFYYLTKNQTFNKKTKDTTITYTNFQLGEITSANAFNPLKINLFYKDFNTVVILDNRLAEISKIDFNTIQPYRNVSFVSTGYDNTLWIFNQDLQQLELFDYKTNKIRLKTVPITAKILDLKSDYNYCYLLTETHLYVYNYFGSLIEKHKNEGYESLAFCEAYLILKKKNQLYILPKNTTEILPIEHPNLLINQFLVTNETLYIYDDERLRQFQLKLE